MLLNGWITPNNSGFPACLDLFFQRRSLSEGKIKANVFYESDINLQSKKIRQP